jgi:predicted nucleotidyltransferase
MGYPTTILDEAIEKSRENQENKRQKIIEIITHVLDDLSEDVDFKEAYLFGSITKPFRFSENSDIDIGFIGLSDRDLFKAMSVISEKTGFDVDVVQLEGHRLKEKIMREGAKWKK